MQTAHTSQSNRDLNGKKVAILVTDGFEQVELTQPQAALKKAGATVKIVAPARDSIRAWDMKKWGKEFKVDASLEEANSDEYDALLLPGGVMSPDHLRINDKAVAFVRSVFNSGKPIAAICHGPWTLVEADVVHGRRMTSYPSLKTDLRNAGAEWVDEEVVVDQGLVTSRNPDDLPAFISKMIEEFAEGLHEERTASAGSRAAIGRGVD
jgi:protease I